MKRSVEWENDRCLILDQRLLPAETVYLNCTTQEAVWDAIQGMAVRGAPAIGIAAGFGFCLGIRDVCHQKATTIEDVFIQCEKTSIYLNSSRPTAVNLAWALNRITSTLQTEKEQDRFQNGEAIYARAVQEALAIQAEDEEVCRQIGEHALSLFHDGIGVLTHCNAGGLATAKYGTALAPMYLAHEKGWKLRVFADETRPYLQGSRLTAYELQQAGIDVTLICDNMAASVMAKGWVDAVIVGTDRVAANGDVANKIGTYGLAILAKAHNIPFYVASPISTIDLNTPSGHDIPIEERHANEVTAVYGQRIAPEGIHVFNPAFDVTPNELVTAIVTEKGIIRAPYNESLKSLFT